MHRLWLQFIWMLARIKLTTRQLIEKSRYSFLKNVFWCRDRWTYCFRHLRDSYWRVAECFSSFFPSLFLNPFHSSHLRATRLSIILRTVGIEKSTFLGNIIFQTLSFVRICLWECTRFIKDMNTDCILRYINHSLVKIQTFIKYRHFRKDNFCLIYFCNKSDS